MHSTPASRRPCRTLDVECLEAREVPAGNVTLAVWQGAVFMAGDSANNQVSVRQNSAGNVVVFGLNGTTINGRSAVFVGRGAPAGLAVGLGGGNDSIQVLGMAARNFFIQGGLGNDTIAMANVRASGNVNVRGGEHADAVFLTGVIANNYLSLDGGGGFDRLYLNNSYGINGTFIVNFERRA